jgi:hypothetical protein
MHTWSEALQPQHFLYSMAWTAHPRCPAHLKEILEKTVNANPVEWLSPPIQNEVFNSPADCEDRLHGFALSQGFDVVKAGALC